jgi:hypothetical protein
MYPDVIADDGVSRRWHFERNGSSYHHFVDVQIDFLR